MTSLYLPAPMKTHSNPTATVRAPAQVEQSSNVNVPTYEERFGMRKGAFVPKSLKAFGDGGAFPEVRVAQYPRNMGNPRFKKSTSTALVSVDESGKVNYDSVVKQNSSQAIVYTGLDAMKGMKTEDADVALPGMDEEEAAAEKTRRALEKIVGSKVSKSKATSDLMLKSATAAGSADDAQYLKYQVDKNAPGYNPNIKSRVIKVISAQVDPMEPPKHKHRKVPGGPAEDPVPILHSPPKKLTLEDQNNWKIPACISNWKNSKGYTIPLDKRLAADGRGIQEKSVNNNFATLAESLYVAERNAREEVRRRGMVRKKIEGDGVKRKEEELRRMAEEARRERGGVRKQSEGGDEDDDDDDDEEDFGSLVPEDEKERMDKEEAEKKAEGVRAPATTTTSEDDVAAQQREKLRRKRKQEREREMRLDNLKGAKRSKVNEERDISEKVALGIHTGQGGGGGVDSRLYNQSEGLTSGFGGDDDYSNVYSSTLFERKDGADSIYTAKRQVNEESAEDQIKKLQRDAPVQFEKSS
ncbi:hypothetical protein TrST_g10950 [Triparma strigata]|uniref:SKI-interacting protein SKIP SNW domain-containing protein n=1 Tax=Triparma strigata TaxID=1606541 RepID=A0A9W7BNH3_9STRA|nr:hypothetical protein TrST_g10950 [Triparma strigata]